MKIFIDTAQVEEIREAAKLGFITGVTTNPSLMAKVDRKEEEVLQDICEIVVGSVSAEVLAIEASAMIREGILLAKISPQIAVKVPMTADGLEATKALSDLGISVNVTLIFTASQALLAARAGAAYVSPFVGRLDEIGQEGTSLIAEIAEIFSLHNIKTEIIAASIRRPLDVSAVALAGAHIATVPYAVLMKALKHPLTDLGIEKFLEDWKKANS